MMYDLFITVLRSQLPLMSWNGKPVFWKLLLRKLSASEMAKSSSDATCKVVAQHMTHNPTTARRFYTHLQSNEDSVRQALNGKRPLEDKEQP